MAIAFQQAGNSGQQTGSSHSFAFNNTGGTELLVVSVCTVENTAFEQVSSITYNGDALTRHIRRTYGGGNCGWVEIWYRVSPATGSNTLAVTLSGTPDYLWVASATSWSGVDTSTPFDVAGVGAEGTNNTGTVSITTATDNTWLVAGFAEYADETITGAGGSQTDDIISQGGPSGTAIASSHKGPIASAGPASISYALSASTAWVMAIAALRPSGAAVTGQPTGRRFGAFKYINSHKYSSVRYW
jgi:hypothetical protein